MFNNFLIKETGSDFGELIAIRSLLQIAVMLTLSKVTGKKVQDEGASPSSKVAWIGLVGFYLIVCSVVGGDYTQPMPIQCNVFPSYSIHQKRLRVLSISQGLNDSVQNAGLAVIPRSHLDKVLLLVMGLFGGLTMISAYSCIRFMPVRNEF